MSKSKIDHLEVFKNEFPQVHDNILNDSGLTKSQRKKFYDYLKKFKTGDRLDYCKKFFYNKDLQLIGANVSIYSQEQLGRVATKTSIEYHITKESNLSLKQIQEAIENAIALGDTEEFLEEFGQFTLSQFLMWSYRNPSNENSCFDNININDLPCILALPDEFGPYYAFGHILPSEITPKIPTAFDAGMWDKWRPGGYTFPLDHCLPCQGLEEVVHEPNYIKNIGDRVVEIL